MDFLYRVKKILLDKKEEELANIEEKIKQVNELYLIEQEKVENLKIETEDNQDKQSEFRRKMLTKRELDDLEVIYNFALNYPKIEIIVQKLRKECYSFYENRLTFIENDSNDIVDEDELYLRTQLYERLKVLNKELAKINDTESEEFLQNTKEVNDNMFEEKKKKENIFSKIFNWKNKKHKALPEGKEKNIEIDLFKQYKTIISDYNKFHKIFLTMYFEDAFMADKHTCSLIMANINTITQIKKRGIELEPKDEEFLKSLEPVELWGEILKYYSNLSLITGFVQRFENKIDFYEGLYKKVPELFDIKNLEKIFEENEQLLIGFKSHKKDVTSKNNEFIQKKQDAKETRQQLNNLENKKKEIIEKYNKIKEAQSLRELGYKNKQDAVKKLSIETKDYIIIPISKNVKSLDELFYDEKNLKIEIGGKIFYTEYINYTATGKINYIEKQDDIDSALMIPIDNLKKENIDNIRNGNIALTKSILQLDGLKLIVPQKRNIDYGDVNISVSKYNSGTIVKQIKNVLSEDFAINSDEIQNYDIFKDIQNVSSREKKLKRDTVKRCLFENIRRNISHTENILVNGKVFFLNKEDEKELQFKSPIEELNEKKLQQFSEQIEEYLIDGDDIPSKIDYFYQKLLIEYMRVNKKARADYFDEKDSNIKIKDKFVSIKPNLPAKNETVAQRYSRTSEDIAYKTMKLANLVNKFAHLTENEELQKELYLVKLDLIEKVIDLSKNNSKINISRRFDEYKMATSVIVEIPKYNMIALHIVNKSNSLMKKSNELDENDSDVLQTSAILYPGVNQDLLQEMKKMDKEERMKLLLNLEPNVFYKLVLRMGYDSRNIVSDEDKKMFIEKMISDEKITELLKENDDLEK